MKRPLLSIISIVIALVIGIGFLFYIANSFGRDELKDYDFSESYDEIRGCYPVNSAIAVNPTYNMECCEDAKFLGYEGDNPGIAGYCVAF